MTKPTREDLLAQLRELRNKMAGDELIIQSLTAAAEEAVRLTEAKERVILDLRADLDRAQQAREEAIDERNAMSRARDSVVDQNNALRDNLHSMGLRNARLEGQLERVREFDPVPARQVYQDTGRRMGAPLQSFRDGYEWVADSAGRAAPPWYRRG